MAKLPKRVRETLKSLNDQVDRSLAARQTYLIGVLDALGVDHKANDVMLSEDGAGYEVTPRPEPPTDE